MFARNLRYQIGKNPKHVVRMTSKQAQAVMETRFIPKEETGPNQFFGEILIPEGTTIEDHRKGMEIVNEFINKNGSPDYTIEDEANGVPLLIRK